MVTSLPSHYFRLTTSVSLLPSHYFRLTTSVSLSLSLSHRLYLTHNIGSASALPIILLGQRHSSSYPLLIVMVSNLTDRLTKQKLIQIDSWLCESQDVLKVNQFIVSRCGELVGKKTLKKLLNLTLFDQF